MELILLLSFWKMVFMIFLTFCGEPPSPLGFVLKIRIRVIQLSVCTSDIALTAFKSVPTVKELMHCTVYVPLFSLMQPADSVLVAIEAV